MTQNAQILNHLKRKPITQWQSIQLYKITRLSGRIKDLEYMGYTIPRRRVSDKKTGKHWTEYLGAYR